MSCPECNAPSPHFLQLCEVCLERKRRVMRHKRSQMLELGKSIQNEKSRYDPRRLILVYLASGVLLLSVLMIVFLLTGPVKSEGPLAGIAFAFAAAFALIYVGTHMLMWIRLVIMDPWWALGAFIMPCLVWKYLKLRWEEPQVRALAIAHFSSLVLVFVSLFGLSKATQLSMIETSLIFDAYVHGEEIDVTEYKKQSTQAASLKPNDARYLPAEY